MIFFFVFQPEAASRVRNSDWSSELCSSGFRGIGKGKYLAAAIGRIRFAPGHRQFSDTVSIGLAPVQRGVGGHDGVIQAADAACFSAKEHGGNRVSVYSSSDVDLVRRQDEMQWLPRLQTDRKGVV